MGVADAFHQRVQRRRIGQRQGAAPDAGLVGVGHGMLPLRRTPHRVPVVPQPETVCEGRAQAHGTHPEAPAGYVTSASER
ncbi:hypothetical protein SSP24_00190 [Streptomyces spinoverrucosus]|uniref:Uncharacterized protein n=1 Tax=Streptomyces spinoverrucosus TaxID=284043 RepID=A0A4Y3V6F5_9ACTN|nr:hypothetical protein SSP24_00190 [Streptomyces spinoverrucosus]